MRRFKVLAVPRDPNPYQELLYRPLRARDRPVRYGLELTPSHTANLLLFSVELAVGRLCGYRFLHIHWTFGFTFPVPRDSGVMRRVSRLWFVVSLRIARQLGYRIVWTAHNVLPHDPIFDDDVKARRCLVALADLVIAHSPQALEGLAEIGARPRSYRVIPCGPLGSEELTRLPPPAGAEPRTVLFFGRVARYKGVEDLLAVIGELQAPLAFIVAGGCSDPDLARRLTVAAAKLSDRVELSLRFVPDEELAALITSADALVFPFRSVTTSSSVMLGLSSGRPAIVPDLPAFAEIPDRAVIRYPAGPTGLRDALLRVAALSTEALRAKGRAARDAAVPATWGEIAQWTDEALHQLVA